MRASKRPEAPLHIGVINPFALAEVIKRKRINWKKVEDPRAFLEKTLKHPYNQLFDPVHGSPLYAGLKLDKESRAMVRVAESPKAHEVIPANVGTTAWVDPGDFFEEGTEVVDPVQGALGDCYFIAALSSVAWARPYVIADRNRSTGGGQSDFVDMIEFFQGGKSFKIEVSELLPLQSPGNTYIYARSAESGEIWPAVYEKAYAKWRTNDSGDQPNYGPIAGGDPVGALAQLTGLTGYYASTASQTADAIWQAVRANSISYKTFNPMVAWTYGTAPTPSVNYNNAHLVANHAYSILGWAFNNNQKYLVLRNPWGTYEATLNVLPPGFTWTAWDQPYYGGKGWWRPIAMATTDGVFALLADTFQAYFAGFGWVKTPEAP